MKKVFFAFCFVILLCTGCNATNNEKKIMNCDLKSTNSVQGYILTSKYTVYYTGDSVNSVETKEEVKSDEESILDYFEKTLTNTYETANENYGGYDNNITRSDNSITSITKIDYNKMDMKKYIDDNTAVKSYVNSDNKFTIDGIKSIYEAMGAICK